MGSTCTTRDHSEGLKVKDAASTRATKAGKELSAWLGLRRR